MSVGTWLALQFTSHLFNAWIAKHYQPTRLHMAFDFTADAVSVRCFAGSSAGETTTQLVDCFSCAVVASF